MVIDILLVLVGLIALLIGTFTDFKTREVPDWISYSLIFFGIGLRLIHSLITNDWSIILWGIIGSASFTVLAFVMFYSGQWGGGDAKLLIGLGAMFGSYPAYFLNWFNPSLIGSFLFAIIVDIFLVGAVFGILYTFYLAIANFKDFKKDFIKRNNIKKIIIVRRSILLISTILLILLIFLPNLLLKVYGAILIFTAVLTFHIWIVVKSVESVCMFKKIEISKLTEGDWVAQDVKVKGKLIYKQNKIGIELKDINTLKKNNIKKVLVKEGIPFIPSFLIGFVLSLIYGNLLFLVLI